MTDLLIREPSPEDAESLARLCVELGYPATPDVMPTRLSRFTSDPLARAYVAEREGRLLGLITVHLRYTLNHDAPIAQITLLVVDETQRGSGVGRALVATAEDWARDHGAKRVVVTTALDRAGVHAFYERVGFRFTGRRYAKELMT